MASGVAKKILLFEIPNENRHKRKYAIKRKRGKNFVGSNKSLNQIEIGGDGDGDENENENGNVTAIDAAAASAANDANTDIEIEANDDSQQAQSAQPSLLNNNHTSARSRTLTHKQTLSIQPTFISTASLNINSNLNDDSKSKNKFCPNSGNKNNNNIINNNSKIVNNNIKQSHEKNIWTKKLPEPLPASSYNIFKLMNKHNKEIKMNDKNENNNNNNKINSSSNSSKIYNSTVKEKQNAHNTDKDESYKANPTKENHCNNNNINSDDYKCDNEKNENFKNDPNVNGEEESYFEPNYDLSHTYQYEQILSSIEIEIEKMKTESEAYLKQKAARDLPEKSAGEVEVEDTVEDEEPFYEELEECRQAAKSTCKEQQEKNKAFDSISPRHSPPPTPPPYESLYSEPIYGHGATGSSSNWTTPPSTIYNNSSNSSAGSFEPYGTNFNFNNPPPPPVTRNNSSNSNLFRTLPKPPTEDDEADNGAGVGLGGGRLLSMGTMAKSCGRKLAKKIMNFNKKLSRSNLQGGVEDNYFNADRNGSLSSNNSGNSNNSNRSRSQSIGNINSISINNNDSSTSSPSCSINGSKNLIPPFRRSVSRPSIPPPSPPNKNFNINSNSNGHPPLKIEDSDSDFYDSDSDLIRNFVSQVQPIYSMDEEPLYQYYTYNYGTTTGVENEPDYQPVIGLKQVKNLGLTLMDMLVPRVGQRTLWCELPEVKSSGILGILSEKQKTLQEAIFEILTSEVSYLKSLEVLISLFYTGLESILEEDEMAALFGNVLEVKAASQSFLHELLTKWEESWYIQEIGEIINRNAKTRFPVYIDYCRNKPFQEKMLQKLRNNNEEFCAAVKMIEEDERCQMLRMDSFLMLPLQRITRLPLLVNAVILRTTLSKERTICEEALENLTQLVIECNEAARESLEVNETAAIIDRIEILNGQIGPLGQFILKGEFMKNPFDKANLNWTFRKNKRTFFWLVLFSNQLLICKRKSNGKFQVLDFFTPHETLIKPLPSMERISEDFSYYFMLHSNKRERVYFLASKSDAEIQKWKNKLDAMREDQVLIKVEVIFPYKANRTDELNLEVGQEINVYKMLPDGWYYGSKEGTSLKGYFPSNFTASM